VKKYLFADPPTGLIQIYLQKISKGQTRISKESEKFQS